MLNIDVINSAYGWTIDEDGEVLGLVNGDMGYEKTGIKLYGDTLEIWKAGIKDCSPNEELRAASGKVDSTDPLVSFLYELMRDHLPPGIAEKIVRNSRPVPTHFTNGYLAEYAKYLAEKLRKE